MERRRSGQISTQECLSIRPHHGLCLQFFEGKGYSDVFAAHMWQIQKLLEKGSRVLITENADEICGKCPNLNNGICTADDKVKRFDKRVMEICGLKEGICLSWNEFSELVQKKIVLAAGRNTVCPDCQWTWICRKKEEDFRQLEFEKNSCKE